MSANPRPFRKDYIERGFARCIEYGIDRALVYSRRFLDEEELRERLAKKKDLIVTAEPFVSQLYHFLKGSGFFAILTDEEGCILSVIGDEDILSEAFALRMVPGAFMDESSIGTNAMGTALAENMPVQVSGDEHFITAYHRWTCSGAPIRDAEGRIIGSLDLTGNSEDVHQHTLGMVVAAVNAIEKTLILGSKNEALKNNKRFIETLIDSIQSGIISVSLEGDILSVNSYALEMFGYEKEESIGRRVDNLIQSWAEVKKTCLSGGDFQNKDVLVEARANKLYFNLTAYPIMGDRGAVTAIILVFKDVKKVRKHANEILGRRAIYTFEKIIGTSRAVMEAIDFARKIADCRSTILISGESGTGKEIFAQAIQNASSRSEEPFVVLNCGAIPRTLIESELFGYAEGAFTGAKRGGQPGKFEIADGGTIFLDEIGEMPLDMQTRLLRVIEEGTVMRIGENREIPVDVRIIAATNKDLKAEVAKGNFRMDLFYRLNVLPIYLPPLRERREDIPLLIDYYMGKLSRKLNKKPVAIDESFLARLEAYDWPGNIRELENMLELIINSEKLPSISVQRDEVERRPPIRIQRDARNLTLDEVEEEHIRATLIACASNISIAAKRLGIGRNTLYRKLERYGIPCSVSEQRSTSEQVISAVAS